MAWVPIHTSGINFTTYLGANMSMVGSTITCVSPNDPDEFGIFFPDGAISNRVRVTVLEYEERFDDRYVDIGTYLEQETVLSVYNQYTEDFEEIFNTAEFSDGVRSEFSPSPAVLPSTAISFSEMFFAPGVDEFSHNTAIDFRMLVEVEVGDTPCFWTDLVNVTQQCGAAPPEPSGFAHFWSQQSIGNGGAHGRITVRYMDYDDVAEDTGRAPYICSTPLFDALQTATEVRVTGIAAMGDPPAGDEPDGANDCEVAMDPDAITWTDVDHEMSLETFGFVAEYYWYNDVSEETQVWRYVRISVDGDTYYGVVYIGSGV